MQLSILQVRAITTALHQNPRLLKPESRGSVNKGSGSKSKGGGKQSVGSGKARLALLGTMQVDKPGTANVNAVLDQLESIAKSSDSSTHFVMLYSLVDNKPDIVPL